MNIKEFLVKVFSRECIRFKDSEKKLIGSVILIIKTLICYKFIVFIFQILFDNNFDYISDFLIAIGVYLLISLISIYALDTERKKNASIEYHYVPNQYGRGGSSDDMLSLIILVFYPGQYILSTLISWFYLLKALFKRK